MNNQTRKQKWKEKTNCMDKQPNQKTEMEEKTVWINNQTRKQKWKKKTNCIDKQPNQKTEMQEKKQAVQINNQMRKQKWKKKLYPYFKRQTGERTRTRPRRRNLQRETESIFIEAQNNAIRTNYIKAKTDNTQWNRICDDRDETVNL